ncbi:MAG: transcriptional regulator [Veillonella sp.]|uniref:transcriptional regulator n=1 Tax=Veillonella TaxID=29465 RepID=UPI00241F92DE|nr:MULTISPECIES: transcriptional regulator [Veillonella]MBS5185578.1 transcriptional regulator [Veillonella parvula]MDU3413352.1 transcriptional regulator [Veillonella parvula]MDU6971937.1 transcriptional regulator [Veillonella sp.]
MELIDTMLIERIRKALIKRYDRDQQIQQMIEEIGAEEGLNETELSIVYQAYLEVKERVYYTSSLVDLWNQIEDVQKRMALLHSYESLEEDLFGDVLGDDKEDIVISNTSELGKGASYNDDAYAMEQVQLSDVPVHHDSTVGMNHIKLNELKSIGGLFTGFGESSGKEMADFEDTAIEHLDVKPLEGVESLAIHHLDEDEALDVDGLDELSKDKKSEAANVDDEDMSSIDPYTAVNALLFGKAGLESDKTNKKMEKLLKKKLKCVDDEWARINGSEDKKSKDDKKSKKDKKSKEDKKEKKHKKSKEEKRSKDEEKLKKKKDKAEKKLKVLNDKLKTVFLADTFKKKDKKKDKKTDKKSKKDESAKKQNR